MFEIWRQEVNGYAVMTGRALLYAVSQGERIPDGNELDRMKVFGVLGRKPETLGAIHFDRGNGTIETFFADPSEMRDLGKLLLEAFGEGEG